MAATRAYLRALALTNARVGDILSLANRALAADVDDGRFVTLFLARLDPAARTLVYANAGHPPGYVLGHDGSVRAVLGSTGLPLGISDEADFPEAEAVALEPGDHVLLLTDGIIEAVGPDRTYLRHRSSASTSSGPTAASPRAGSSRPSIGPCATSRATDDLIDDVTSLVIKVGPSTARREGP